MIRDKTTSVANHLNVINVQLRSLRIVRYVVHGREEQHKTAKVENAVLKSEILDIFVLKKN